VGWVSDRHPAWCRLSNVRHAAKIESETSLQATAVRWRMNGQAIVASHDPKRWCRVLDIMHNPYMEPLNRARVTPSIDTDAPPLRVWLVIQNRLDCCALEAITRITIYY
jgi:hypothetical protein